MIWRFSDGTEVELGGSLRGESAFAQELRRELPTAVIYPWPPPCSLQAVDPRDAAFLDAWLRQQLDIAVRIDKLQLTLQRPEGVPPLPSPPWAGKPLPRNVVH